MKTQNYHNHRRWYAPHHFILLPLIGVGLTIGIYQSFNDEANQLTWVLFSISMFFMLFIQLMIRQHYALGNQNRIVRLEFRLRYFEVFGKSSEAVERQLSFSQLAALRFANDKEFKTLLMRVISEKLSTNEIKKSIQNWQADDMRI